MESGPTCSLKFMRWEPADIIRLTALVGGFLLCGSGGILMWLGVGAEGVVDIKSSILSGTVQTGSAGLFTLFFGFGIIIFVLATLSVKSTNASLSVAQRKSRTRQITFAFWGILACFVFTASMGAIGYGSGFGGASFFCVLAFFTGVAYVVQLENE